MQSALVPNVARQRRPERRRPAERRQRPVKGRRTDFAAYAVVGNWTHVLSISVLS